jgi:predicted  nucleic acid-binding Zn-ribbon protein
MKARRTRAQDKSKTQDESAKDLAEQQIEYPRIIKAAEQRLQRLEALLRTASGDRRMGKLQQSVDAERQQIAELKAVSAKSRRRSRATQYVQSKTEDPEQKTEATEDLLDKLKKFKQ